MAKKGYLLNIKNIQVNNSESYRHLLSKKKCVLVQQFDRRIEQSS